MEDADLTRADAVGIPITLVVLLVMFGSLVAATGGGLNSIVQAVLVPAALRLLGSRAWTRPRRPAPPPARRELATRP